MNEDANDLFAQFARISELLHRHQHWTRRAHGPGGDPHRGQGRVMALLKMQPEITQKELSFLLDIRPQSLGELLAKLERGGFIERTPSDTDRRGMNIRLTDAGAKAADQSTPASGIFASLAPEEQATLAGYLERIIADLEKSLGEIQEKHGFDREPHGHCPHGPHGMRGHGPHGRRGPHGHDRFGCHGGHGRHGEHEDRESPDGGDEC